MEEDNNVKYNEDEFILNDQNDSVMLNQSNEEINKKISDKEDKKSENQYDNESFIKNKSDKSQSKKSKNESKEENNKADNIDKKLNDSKQENSINNNKEDIINKQEENINLEENNSKELQENNKNIYIMKKEDKKSSDSELMSETEVLKMSLNENEKNINEDAKEEEKNNEEKEEKIEKEEKKENEDERKKEIIKTKENEENKSNNDSEHIIDSIIQNELQEIPKENDNKIVYDNNIETHDKKYISLKDLEDEPYKEMKINSPRSLKLIKDNGYTYEELYYNPDKNENESEENIRLNKIKKLSELRNKLIEEESQEKDNKDINKDENEEIIKKFILNTQEKILDYNLERIKNKNDIELANIVQYELDKNLSKLELKKSADDFKKEKLKLKSYEIILKNRNKKSKGKQYKTLENPNPIVTQMKTPNENLKSFYIGKRQNEFSYYQQKLAQKLEKIELINIKKHQKLKLRQNADEARAKMNLRKSEEKFNNKLELLKKKMEWKGLVTGVIKNIIKKDQSQKKEFNKQKEEKKKDYIIKMRKREEIEREQKLEILNKKGATRKDIQNMTRRIYSSRIDRFHTMEKDRITNISKIQKILKNGEGENEKNLDILMEEFPDNPRIAEVIKDYQIKKDEIKHNDKLRLYSSNGNLYNNNPVSSYFRTLTSNNYNTNRSMDKRRIFLFTDKKREKFVKKKNERIKTEERRINNMNESPKLPKDELNDDLNGIHYEDDLKEKIRIYKMKIYKKFLKKVKEEKNNEINRKKQLKMIKDHTLRKNLDIQFSNERALIDLRLRKESENLQKLAKDYENKLRSKFLKRQDRILNLVKEVNEKKK